METFLSEGAELLIKECLPVLERRKIGQSSPESPHGIPVFNAEYASAAGKTGACDLLVWRRTGEALGC
jgi:hypothetical protein